MIDIHHILVAVDFGASSERALELGAELAGRFGASLTVVHCCELPGYAYPAGEFLSVDLLSPIEDAADEQMETTLARVRAEVPGARCDIRRGRAADEILAAVRENHADLVITGTHGRRGVTRALVGSVAERVVRLSPVPVLTVRGVTFAAPPGGGPPGGGAS